MIHIYCLKILSFFEMRMRMHCSSILVRSFSRLDCKHHVPHSHSVESLAAISQTTWNALSGFLTFSSLQFWTLGRRFLKPCPKNSVKPYVWKTSSHVDFMLNFRTFANSFSNFGGRGEGNGFSFNSIFVIILTITFGYKSMQINTDGSH